MDLSTLSPLLQNPVGRPIATDSAALQSSASADFDSFLTLLTAQLQNQDPLSPLDATEFVAQLASFSSVEQLVGVNDKLESLAGQSLASDIATFSSWIGRDVAAGSGVFRGTGEPVNFSFAEPLPGQQLRATVQTVDGREVTTFPVLTTAGGSAVWDGRDSRGTPITDSDLTIQLDYVEGGTPARTVPAEVLRRVSGIQGSANGMILELSDGGTLAPEQVVSVQDAQNISQSPS